MQLKAGKTVVQYSLVHPDGKIPVVILHGWGHSGAMWQHVVQQLPENYRCYLIDLPGFGHSPLGEVKTLDDYVEVVREFLEKNDLPGVVVIGHSFGAQVAVRAVNSSVSKLILVAPALKRQRSIWGAGFYKMLGVLARFKALVPASIRYHLASGTDYVQASPALRKIFKHVIAIDVTADLAQLSLPVLMVWGENDRDVLGSGKELAESMKQAKLKVVYDAGHNLYLEKPEELIRMIERFV